MDRCPMADEYGEFYTSFDYNNGSLCHGWSAMPIYYYHI